MSSKYKFVKYLHEISVRAGFVSSPGNWLYSSAFDYCETGTRLLALMVLESIPRKSC
jgi:hypothetical protein